MTEKTLSQEIKELYERVVSKDGGFVDLHGREHYKHMNPHALVRIMARLLFIMSKMAEKIERLEEAQ